MDWSPLWISLRVAFWATILSVVIGLVISYPLARMKFHGREVLIGLTTVPLVLPPTVLGYALLVAFGQRSFLGIIYHHLTHQALVFTWQAAVVASCVCSIPLFISHAVTAISQIDEDVIDAARVDGAWGWDIARKVIVPLAMPGLVAGTSLAFARALGEFGATMMFAGDTPGDTQTLPIAIYDALNAGDMPVVHSLVPVCIAIAVGVCVLTSRLRVQK
jgi:molybdate transport system permease protein